MPFMRRVSASPRLCTRSPWRCCVTPNQSRNSISPSLARHSMRLSSARSPPMPALIMTGTPAALSSASTDSSEPMPSAGYTTSLRTTRAGPSTRCSTKMKCDSTSRVKPPSARCDSQAPAPACQGRGQAAKRRSMRTSRSAPSGRRDAAPKASCSCARPVDDASE